MNESKLNFEIKRLELMIGKIQSQKTVAKASVLSASIQMEGFWYNECEIEPQILAAALTQQLLNLRKQLRGRQVIEKA
jgi:hypothetical protein